MEDFLSEHGVTFTVLVDLPGLDVTAHYDIGYWSEFWLLDRYGNRIGNQPILFTTQAAEQMLSAGQTPRTWDIDYLGTQ